LLGQRVVPIVVAAGAAVTTLDRPGGHPFVLAGCTRVEADLAGDFSVSLARAGVCDAVVHLAQAGGWRSFPDRAGSIAAVALAATARLAEHAARVGAKTFVLASSGGIYGPSPGPIAETDPIRPSAELGFYLASKAAAENLLSYFEPHMAVHRLRYFFIYGPGQSEDFLMARLRGQILRGEPIWIAGGRGPRLNPIYVDDAAEATAAALAADVAVTANVAGPETSDLRSIAELLGGDLGRTPVFRSTDEGPDDYVADIGVMVRRLGLPTIGLASGLSSVGKRASKR
jgi:UDP-glucose 4-epimerase